MKNDTRSNVHHRHTALCLALSAALFAAPVSAEVGLPPPAQHQGAGFPSEQALRQKGYDPKTGVWRVQSQNNGRPTVTKSGDTIKGSQPKTVTATGNYGEKGTFRTTQTQTVNIGRIETIAGGTLAGMTAAGGAIGSDFAANAYKSAQYGDWGGAAREAVGAVIEGLSKLDITGFGSGVNQFLEKTGIREGASSGQLAQAAQQAATAQAQAEKNGDFSKAVEAAAAKKAAEEAAKAKGFQQAQQKAQEDGKPAEIWVASAQGQYKSYGGSPQEACSGSVPGFPGASFYYVNGSCLGGEGKPQWLWGVEKIKSIDKPAFDKSVLEKMKITQNEIKDILARMLNNQQTNHAELMNQLAKIGDAVEKSTESNQFTPMTADSAPYTPQGSNTPQQTRFTLNADGSVSTSIIPRPDLKPNSTLAPTRSEIIPTPNRGQNTPTTPNSPNTPTTPDSPNAPTPPNSPNTPNQPNNPTGQQNQNQENQQQNFCQQNPNAAQCMQGGDMTYEDIVLPENTIDLDFRPENVFQTEGVCPQPKSVDLGAFGQVEFSYQPLCDFAAKLRPVLIMMTILTCAWFVYGALEEL